MGVVIHQSHAVVVYKNMEENMETMQKYEQLLASEMQGMGIMEWMPIGQWVIKLVEEKILKEIELKYSYNAVDQGSLLKLAGCNDCKVETCDIDLFIELIPKWVLNRIRICKTIGVYKYLYISKFTKSGKTKDPIVWFEFSGKFYEVARWGK